MLNVTKKEVLVTTAFAIIVVGLCIAVAYFTAPEIDALEEKVTTYLTGGETTAPAKNAWEEVSFGFNDIDYGVVFVLHLHHDRAKCTGEGGTSLTTHAIDAASVEDILPACFSLDIGQEECR